MEVGRDTGPAGQLSVDLIEGEEAERQWAARLDQAFTLGQGRFLDDFPAWSPRFAKTAATLRIGAFRGAEGRGERTGRELVATAGVKIAQLRVPAGTLPVAVVGAVSTDEEHRGKGLATQLVRFAVQWAQERGAAAVFLWGSEHALYRRIGFELCGGQARLPLAELSLPETGPQLHHRVGWDDSIFELMRRRPRGLALEAADIELVRAHRNVEWHWLGEPGRPIAYAAIGRGIDLQGMVHEWGGGPRALSQLLACIRARHPVAELLGSPELLEAFGMAVPPERVEFLCMAQVLDPQAALAALLPDVSATAQFESATVSWQVALKNSRLTANAADLAAMLFGPESVHELLPFPLWLWGLDSA